MRVKAVGASGSTSAMGMDTAVLSAEVVDSPRSLKAVTLAITSAKSAKLNGEFLSVVIGMVHYVSEIIVLSFSASQLFASIEKVDPDVLISSS